MEVIESSKIRKCARACAADVRNYFEKAEELYRQVLNSDEKARKEMAYFRLGEVLRKTDITRKAIAVFSGFP